uniref:Midasin n=1 Tax=Anisakis simplex TaxID=6269 RepID=A0A0M3J6D0_ANISI
LDKLCLEHEAESLKQHRRLRKLFQRAFECLKQFRQDAETFLNNSQQQQSAMATMVS